MIADSFFEQGFKHSVCEDYAIHGNNYAIISDGCSNGKGPRINSDWGSRILCKVAEDLLLRGAFEQESFGELVIRKSLDITKGIPNLDPTCLTATLLMAFKKENEFITIAFGDGVVGGKIKGKNEWLIFEIVFPSGAPFYLKYTLCKEDLKLYREKFGTEVIMNTYYGETHNLAKSSEDRFNLSLNPLIVNSFYEDVYDMVFIASDGVGSFTKLVQNETNKFSQEVKLEEVLSKLLDFKVSPNMLSLQRNWLFKQNKNDTFVKLGWKNHDDVSMGVITDG